MEYLDPGILLIAALQFTTVTLLIWAIFRYPVRPEPPANRQIAMSLGLVSRTSVFDTPIIGQLLSLCVVLAGRFPFFRDRVRQDLEASGNPSGYSVDEYLGMCLASGITVGLASLLILGRIGQFDFVLTLLAPAIGFAIPLFTLRSEATGRVRAIGKKLPYTLDLVALLMEAGASFTEAVATLIRDEPDDQLNHELALVQAEIEFGTTRASALANMSDRIPLDSLRSVIGAINQAEALGTPLSTILKNQAGMIRMLRSVRAEEAAASASMKILIPGVLILMAVVLVVFSPLILKFIEGRGM